MIETRVIIVDQSHTARKKRGKRFITHAIVKVTVENRASSLAAATRLSTVVKPGKGLAIAGLLQQACS